MSNSEKEARSLWSNFGSLGGIVLGIVLILVSLALSFWVAFVALAIPLIVAVMIAGFLVSRRETPDTAEEQDLTNAGYQGPEAEYGVEPESTTGDPVT